MQRVVGDRVFDHKSGARFAHWNLAPRTALNLFRAEILLRDFISPVAERAFGKFHDVALVHQRHAFAAIGDCVGNRAVNQAHAAGTTDRFDADSYANFVAFRRANLFPELRRSLLGAKANFVEFLWKFLFKKIENRLRFGSARGEFNARVDVFRVFPKDYHVHFLRVLEGRGDTFEVLHWPQANEKIEKLPQGDVERANPATDRRGQRPFDSDQKFAERFHRIVGQPFTEFVLRCLTGENFKPRDLFLAAKSFFDRGIEHPHARGPDVRSRAISTNEWNDGLFRNIQFFGSGNLFTCGRRNIFVRHKGQTVEAAVLSRNGVDGAPPVAAESQKSETRSQMSASGKVPSREFSSSSPRSNSRARLQNFPEPAATATRRLMCWVVRGKPAAEF